VAADEAFGPFRLLRKLGSGGMAEVFLARRVSGSGPAVAAVKRTLPDLADNPAVSALFEREQRLAQTLDHPRIARIHEVGLAAGRPFIAMELVLGTNLAGLRRRSKTRPAVALGYAATVRLLRDVCEGLDHAHCAQDGIAHGDVHLQNIMVTYDGAPKLIDFGVARAAGEIGLGKPGGTYAYMAPEQLRGEPFDRRADVFAVGAVAWELFTGVPLFRRRNNVLTMRAVVEQPPPRLGAFMPKHQAREAERLDRVLSRALAKEADDRIASCADLARELREAAGEAGWTAPDSDHDSPADRDELTASVCGVFATERAAIVRGLSEFGDLERWMMERPHDVPLVL